ncbi:hypothetical protein FNV43_RR04589 [Rhamnella rubrinervis]|uniref:Uncharacterized protein n=1 Tax=Rhamnella rubrinervis TaxID=2594499 RepID=A0A8K0HJV1_9ROSA|nr:hypothetical protein FNV43_RR04589 [Rhamnella rubrinervis]
MASERRPTLSSMVIMPDQREEEVTPVPGHIAGLSAAGSGAIDNDNRFEQLLAQMEELVQSTRAQQQRNEVQEQVNRQLLEAFNAVRTPIEQQGLAQTRARSSSWERTARKREMQTEAAGRTNVVEGRTELVPEEIQGSTNRAGNLIPRRMPIWRKGGGRTGENREQG